MKISYLARSALLTSSLVVAPVFAGRRPEKDRADRRDAAASSKHLTIEDVIAMVGPGVSR